MSVTVLMAVHNGEDTLAQCLAAMFSDMGPLDEAVIVNDASSDNTAAILADQGDKRLRVLTNDSNLGLTKSLNRGLDIAKCEFIARLDADDISLPGRFLAQRAALEGDRADICFGAYGRERRNQPTETIRPQDPKLIFFRSLFENAFGAHPTAMIRTETLRQLGGYDPSLAVAQDYDLWHRARMAGASFRFIDKVILSYRDHEASVSQTRQAEQQTVTAMISDRALGAVFNDITPSESKGLRYLMAKGSKPATEDEFDLALRNLEGRIKSYTHQQGGSLQIWPFVSDCLMRRRRDLGPNRHRNLQMTAARSGFTIRALWRSLTART